MRRKRFDIKKTKKIIFVDSNGVEMTVNDMIVEKIPSVINEYHLWGHVGDENCSGADVGMEFRSVPNKCRKKGRTCCDL